MDANFAKAGRVTPESPYGEESAITTQVQGSEAETILQPSAAETILQPSAAEDAAACDQQTLLDTFLWSRDSGMSHLSRIAPGLLPQQTLEERSIIRGNAQMSLLGSSFCISPVVDSG